MTNVRKPTFFIVGAPKCGTTAMWEYLSTHPCVYMTKPKEPHFFNFDHRYRIVQNWTDYVALYENAPLGTRVLGEASVWYLYSKEAIREIRRLAPSARILVMIRNPVEMMPSLHSQLCHSGREDVVDVEIAWRLQERRALGECLPRKCIEPSHLQYKDVCSLGTLLKRVYEIFPAEQILVTLFDDLVEDPRKEYLRVLNFLGLRDDGKENFEIVNQGKTVHSWRVHRAMVTFKRWWARYGVSVGTGLFNRVQAANTGRRKTDISSTQFRKELQGVFEGEIRMLEDLLQRNLGKWRVSNG